MNKDYFYLREMKILSQNVSSETINSALEDMVWHIRLYAVNHPRSLSEHIDKGLNDIDKDVRKAAINRIFIK